VRTIKKRGGERCAMKTKEGTEFLLGRIFPRMPSFGGKRQWESFSENEKRVAVFEEKVLTISRGKREGWLSAQKEFFLLAKDDVE